MESSTQRIATTSSSHPTWWHGAVIYQVYPRSLFDSDGNGVGDLPGIIEKLEYIRDLGADAVWISPFFKSPMKDFGYDISDYRAVDPLFGSLEDFDRLVARAHGLGLRIIIDQVLSHTSDQHPWFEESRVCRDNARSDWYVWADPKPDGSPPNNWLSIFGGSAWTWESRRQQYYLHNFLASQPDLNYHNPAVRDQMLAELEFWLARGVDGVRLDAINFCFHDDQLRDNPAKPASERRGLGFRTDNPYAYQRHVYDNTRPENLEFLGRLRGLLDRYGAMSLGEISAEDTHGTIAEYLAGSGRLHTAYSFELLAADFDASLIRETVEAMDGLLDDGFACWSVGNHDVARVASRWGGDGADPAFAKLVGAALLSLRGCACIYQGDELGLPEAEIPRHALQDPYGIAFWPTFKGRDGCRTPFPWRADEASAGFTTGEPWLPVPSDHAAMAVDRQDADPGSVLNFYRKFLAWRRRQEELQVGTIEFLEGAGTRLAFLRRQGAQTLLCCFNFGTDPARFELPGGRWQEVTGHGFDAVDKPRVGTVELPPLGAWFARQVGEVDA